MSRKQANSLIPTSRRRVVLGLLGLAAVALLVRVTQLHVAERDFLQRVGAELAQRTLAMPAHRGVITDRVGNPLAVSIPVSSVWVDPRIFSADNERLPQLARVLNISEGKLRELLQRNSKRGFVWLQRRVKPALAAQVEALGLKGVGLQREFRRFYPTGERSAHLLGFTNVDDHGQEGLERALDKQLAGIPGKRRVMRDRRGRVVDSLGIIQAPQPGGKVALSIDSRVQYLAHEALRKAVDKHQAKGGSAVVLDVRTGEVLAMANQPDFNPNQGPRKPDHYRNRAVTDLFEPGSTLKSFVVAAALESGTITPSSRIDTRPGFIKVGRKTITDHHPYGVISPAKLLTKSSNVGAVKVALSIAPNTLHDLLIDVGIGQRGASGLPGEARGRLMAAERWKPLDIATLAFGYGISTNLLQLAGAYAVIAANGIKRPISMQPLDDSPGGKRVLSARTAAQLREMLETVVLPGGTATRARVPGYRVAGKTGTTRMLGPDGRYQADHHRALFVGMAPASRPRLVVAVVVDDPGGKAYYGGLVAAPAVGEILAKALRLLDVAPDDVETLDRYVAQGGRQ